MKYEITDIEHPKHKNCFRIRALKSFGKVKKGDLGGYLDKESNMDQDGTGWLYGGTVCLGSNIGSNAQIYHSEIINSGVYDRSVIIKSVIDHSGIYDNTVIKDSKLDSSVINGKSTIQNKSNIKRSRLADVFVDKSGVFFSYVYDGARIISSKFYKIEWFGKNTFLGVDVRDKELKDFRYILDIEGSTLDGNTMKRRRKEEYNRQQKLYNKPIHLLSRIEALEVIGNPPHDMIFDLYTSEQAAMLFKKAGIKPVLKHNMGYLK